MWMITWFVAAEEAQSGKQQNHSICMVLPGTF